MRRLIVPFLLVLAACSPGESADTTTSTSTTESTTPTTGTPTTAAPTTTTIPTSTTTVEATTTTTLLAGSWADQPLMVTAFGALGWWEGSGWIDAETAGALPVVGGEDYQTIVLDELDTTTAGPQTVVCDPLELIGVELADPLILGDFPGPYGVAISAPWDLQPHLFSEESDSGGTYAGFASELLASRGLDVPDPVIRQLIRTDLEGDGVNEVLVVAEELSEGWLLEPGDYSIVFLRKVVQGEVQTAVLGASVILEGEDVYQAGYRVGTVADLNGDGKMEIVTNSAFFEGFGVSVWEYVNDDLGPVEQLAIGCGV